MNDRDKFDTLFDGSDAHMAGRPRIVQLELEDLPDTHTATAQYIESLEQALMRVQNFPAHPGGRDDDISSEQDDPASWRHGWICAVEAMQDAARPNVEFSGVPAGHSSNRPAGGTSAGTHG